MTSNIPESYIGKTMERSKWLAKLISNPRTIETQYGPTGIFNFNMQIPRISKSLHIWPL